MGPSPRYLYKYATGERSDILRNLRIRFTQPGALNDPFELEPMFEELLPEEGIRDATKPPWEMLEESLFNQYSELPENKKKQINFEQFIALLKRNPALIELTLESFEKQFRGAIKAFTPRARSMLRKALNTQVGILSLSETCENMPMWSHYANSHRGLVIEFDSTHEFFDRRRNDGDELYHLRKVRYLDRSIEGRTLNDIDGGDLLATKQKSWSYEREWRMLLPLKDAGKRIEVGGDSVYLFDIHPATITRVILGSRYSKSLEDEVASALNARELSHVGLARASLNPSTQSIDVKSF